MRYAVVIEKGEKSFGAYVPGLPGCVAVGKTEDDARRLIAEAIALHRGSMRITGEERPPQASAVEYVEVPADGRRALEA